MAHSHYSQFDDDNGKVDAVYWGRVYEAEKAARLISDGQNAINSSPTQARENPAEGQQLSEVVTGNA